MCTTSCYAVDEVCWPTEPVCCVSRLFADVRTLARHRCRLSLACYLTLAAIHRTRTAAAVDCTYSDHPARYNAIARSGADESAAPGRV